MATIELAIDFGSSFITICQKGIGVVLHEPSIAIIEENKGHFEIKSAGNIAKSVLAKSMGGAKIVKPIQEGIVVDVEITALLLKYFLKSILPKTFFKPTIKVMALTLSTASNSDRKAIEKACLKAGAAEVTLVETPLAILAYLNKPGALILDVGAGKTECCVVTNHGITNGNTVNIGGDSFNRGIIDGIKKSTDVLVGENTIEKIKISSLSFYTDDVATNVISGTHEDGTPRAISVSVEQMRDGMIELVDDIMELVQGVLHDTPPDVASQVLKDGIFVCGGCMNIPGLVDYIEAVQNLKVTKIDDGIYPAVIGACSFFDNLNMLSDMLGVNLK